MSSSQELSPRRETGRGLFESGGDRHVTLPAVEHTSACCVDADIHDRVAVHTGLAASAQKILKLSAIADAVWFP
jgi:pyruvate-formate lyase-activating enzyme